MPTEPGRNGGLVPWYGAILRRHHWPRSRPERDWVSVQRRYSDRTSEPAQVSTAALPCGRSHSLRNQDQLMATAAASARGLSISASHSAPITISAAIASRNARTGLSRAAAAINHMAQVGRLLTAHYRLLTLTSAI